MKGCKNRKTAYYNEFDPAAAAWLRELINAGHIAPGVVDERSIEDVLPSDLQGFTQCHFFAGIGVWSYALRRAGWPDDRPVWTGSCPCQPFSAAGKGSGFDDERHLWPAFHHLIEQCRPAIVLGEQVASKDGLAWLDLVQTDMEGADYACAAVDTCAAGFGAPHIRQRLYWVAHAGLQQPQQPTWEGARPNETQRGRPPSELAGRSYSRGLADTSDQRQHGRRPGEAGNGRDAARVESERFCNAGGMADAESLGKPANELRGHCINGEQLAGTRAWGNGVNDGRDAAQQPPTGPVNGFWADTDWLFCRDGKWRPVEPGTFPLVNGAAARVVRLRGYGNAINAAQAQGFIEAVMEIAA